MPERGLEQRLEWEPGATPRVYEHVEWPVPPFIAGMRKLSIERDEKFHLRLVAEGSLENKDEFRQRREKTDAIPAGTFRDYEEIDFNAHGWRCTLRAFLDDLPDATFSPDEIHFRQRGHLIRLVANASNKLVEDAEGRFGLEAIGQPSWRTEWFINGPHAPHFLRFSTRRRQTAFSRRREFGDISVDELPNKPEARDHFVVDAQDFCFAVCSVPEGFAPDWSHAIAIEFRQPIPDEETREAVAEIVSFALGRRLLRLGSTVFDESGWSVEEEVVNPFAEDPKQLCGGADLSPLSLRVFTNDIEAVLGQLVPSYLKARAELGLRNALWAYWAACEAASPVDLALFRAAVEALKKGWFESAGTKSRGVYMPKEEFELLTSSLVDAMRTSLGDRDGASAIIDKLGRAHQMGSNEQVRAFFSEIALPVGSAEAAAMKAANVPAHGGIAIGNRLKEFVCHGRAYRTLFERTFLRLLGYDGEYTDRTALRFPSRPLNEPAGGDILRGG